MQKSFAERCASCTRSMQSPKGSAASWRRPHDITKRGASARGKRVNSVGTLHHFICAGRQTVCQATKQESRLSVVFSFTKPPIASGDSLAICGSEPELGKWDLAQAKALNRVPGANKWCVCKGRFDYWILVLISGMIC
jgi:hypothetical protein